MASNPGQLSLAIPSWVGAMSTSQRAVTPCGGGIKAGVIRVWVAGKNCVIPCYTLAISERVRDNELIYKALYKFSCLLYFVCLSHITKQVAMYGIILLTI